MGLFVFLQLTESILAKAGKLRMVAHATGRYFVSGTIVKLEVASLIY